MGHTALGQQGTTQPSDGGTKLSSNRLTSSGHLRQNYDPVTGLGGRNVTRGAGSISEPGCHSLPATSSHRTSYVPGYSHRFSITAPLSGK